MSAVSEKMIRKQLYVDAATEEALKRYVYCTGRSEASVVREAVGRYLAEESKKGASKGPHPLLAMIGAGRSTSGPTDSAENHDKYLYQEDPRRKGENRRAGKRPRG